METLSVEGILDKGLESESLLSELEWPIFVVAYLESIADMEGWDHFFTYNLAWYSQLLDILRLSGDFRSLGIIKDYENHLIKHGVEFKQESIDAFLTKAPDDYFDSCPDWREQFQSNSESRWKLIERYYSDKGLRVKT